MRHTILLALALLNISVAFALTPPNILNSSTPSKGELKSIGEKIYQNETGGNPQYLIAFNEGEAFASLGIGHFIWFPAGLDSPFTETFPDLVEFMQSRGVELPNWLTPASDAPWPTKQAFLASLNSPQMAELRQFLMSTFEHQIAFIHQRMQGALSLMLSNIDNPEHAELITKRFKTLERSSQGLYALIDYINFKGEGTALSERYKGQGWGLLQVLSNMDTATLSYHQAFTQACKDMLSRRVANSPQAEVEQKWIIGWHKRCDTYSQ